MKTILKLCLLCCGLGLLTACTIHQTYEQGKRFNTENVSKIVKGQTTESEVIALLGEPANRTNSSDGRVILMFHYSKTDTAINTGFYGLGGGSQQATKRESVTVVLQGGIVQDVSTSSGSL